MTKCCSYSENMEIDKSNGIIIFYEIHGIQTDVILIEIPAVSFRGFSCFCQFQLDNGIGLSCFSVLYSSRDIFMVRKH